MRSTGVPPPAPENTLPAGSATSDESKGDKGPEEEPVGLAAPLVPRVPPGPEEPGGAAEPRVLLILDVPVIVPPPNTGMEMDETGDLVDWNDSDIEGAPDNKGEGDPEPEV